MSQMQVGGGMVHPLAVVEEGADIGRGTMIWRFTHVRSGAVIGSNCILGNCVYIDIDVHIGNGVKIQNCGLLYAGVTLEDEVFVGPNVTFTNDRYPRATSPDWQIVPTHVCHGASIGANATVVCGTVIGHYAMIAAGSVVTKDVAPFRLVRGNPARPAGYVCICGRKLGDNDLDIAQPIRCTCGSVVDLAAARVLRPKK
ncbi:MAG TPA: acyltransferase [Armatimonadota bacterium]